mgnify:CR=1 FL=1
MLIFCFWNMHLFPMLGLMILVCSKPLTVTLMVLEGSSVASDRIERPTAHQILQHTSKWHQCTVAVVVCPSFLQFLLGKDE